MERWVQYLYSFQRGQHIVRDDEERDTYNEIKKRGGCVTGKFQ
jgi:hypothetical protein